jgi:hypothetical protein
VAPSGMRQRRRPNGTEVKPTAAWTSPAIPKSAAGRLSQFPERKERPYFRPRRMDQPLVQAAVVQMVRRSPEIAEISGIAITACTVFLVRAFAAFPMHPEARSGAPTDTFVV